MKQRYYATQNRNGTEDEITIYTPEGRAMLCVAFWDDLTDFGFGLPERSDKEAKSHAAQLKADAELIVNALNAYRPRKPRKKLTDYERVMAKAKAVTMANLRKPMPKKTPYRE